MGSRIRCAVMAAALAAALFGCGETNAGLSEGTYAALKSGGAVPPSITFDLDESCFVFSYDPLSSYLNAGTFEIADGKVAATTHDGKYRFVFKIKDRATIVFLQKESSAVSMTDGEPAVSDGAAFRLRDG